MYYFSPHTADLKIYVENKNLQALFKDALLAMTSYLKPHKNTGKVIRKIIIKSSDQTSLLIDFLNEVLFLIHTKKEFYTSIKFLELSERTLKAQIIGQKASSFEKDIKAATYHEAHIKKTANNNLSTNLVLDI